MHPLVWLAGLIRWLRLLAKFSIVEPKSLRRWFPFTLFQSRPFSINILTPVPKTKKKKKKKTQQKKKNNQNTGRSAFSFSVTMALIPGGRDTRGQPPVQRYSDDLAEVLLSRGAGRAWVKNRLRRKNYPPLVAGSHRRRRLLFISVLSLAGGIGVPQKKQKKKQKNKKRQKNNKKGGN